MSSKKIEAARRTIGVTEDAGKEEVKLAYRRLCSVHHPDRGGDRNKFDEINKAYRLVIKSVERGRECDACLGTGKANVTRGFNSISINCTQCKGTGVIHG
jgi:DnaJ-class molecular chaperone